MKLFHRKYGEGPPLIILHGLYGSSDNWATIGRLLSDTFTVYIPDQRNHGKSPHSEIHDYKSMSDDVFELAGELKLSKFFLAGHSMGGKTAISFALKWPEMLNGLLIADISPFVNENSNRIAYNQHVTILDAILSINPEEISTRADAEEQLSMKIPSVKTRGFILKNLERIAGNIFEWKINAVSLRRNLNKIMEGIDRTSAITNQVTGFPVTFLRGEESEYITDNDYPDILKVFPAAEIIKIPGAGHWIHADKPDEVIKHLKKLKEDS
jgi:pimeloyl-ACP methyl ester carboxylesterase